MLYRSNAIRHTIADSVIFGGQHVVVAMSAGNTQCRPAHQQPRTGNIARIDGVAQGDIAEIPGSDIADRRKSGQQRKPRILGAGERLPRHGDCQTLVAELGLHGQVRVRVDQSRQHGCIRQFDVDSVRGNLRLCRSACANDPSVFDH